MGKRIVSTISGLASLVAVAAIIVGPPTALVLFVGNPLPSTMPSVDELTDALTARGVSDEVLINTLTILAWIIWVQLATAILVEVAAQLRRRPTPHLPAFPGCQAMAGNLVAGVVLLGSLFNPSRADATQPEFSIPQREPIAQVEQMPPEREPAPAPSPKPEQPTTTYDVHRHDSLWSIAETVLGDGMRWREIRDLNIGVAQPDGGSLTATSDIIHPGWTLQIPTPQPTNMDTAVSTHTVVAGEHLWKIAKDALKDTLGREPSNDEIDPYWRDLIEINRQNLPDPTNPSLIFPDHTLTVPPAATAVSPAEASTSEDEPISEASTPDESSPPAPGIETRRTTPPRPTEAGKPPRAEPEPQVPTDRPGSDNETRTSDAGGTTGATNPGLLGVAGAGLAAAVGFRIHRARQNRQARAPLGAVVPPIPDDLRDIQRDVATNVDPDRLREVQSATFELARHASDHPDLRCRPRLIQLGAKCVEVLLDTPEVDVPEGWTAESSGEAWSRPRTTEISAPERLATPLVVTVGQPEDGIEILYDLESAGLTVASGEPELVAGTIRSLLRELVHGPAELHVLTIGKVPTVDHERVLSADTWDEDADHALAWAEISADTLKAHKFDNAFAARGSGRPMDGLIPLLVICDHLPDDDRFERLIQMSGHAAVGVLALAERPQGRGTDLIITEHGAAIPALGLDFQTQRIDQRTSEQIDRLIECADAPAETPSTEPPAPPHLPTGVDATNKGKPYRDPPYDILVRVLGKVDVEGGNQPLKPKQLGLLTYIAAHPGCTVEQVEEAVWPEPMASRRHRLHTTLWAVRSAIGTHQIPKLDEPDGYRVADTVRTDLDLFKRRVKYACDRPRAEAIGILRGALELVTGQPFSYTSVQGRSLTWIDYEDWTFSTESLVVQAAEEMSRLCEENGDPDSAIWATRKGLLASPTNTELTNRLMEVHVSAGEIEAAKRVFRDHERALDHLELGEPEESTLKIWESLGDAQ